MVENYVGSTWLQHKKELIDTDKVSADEIQRSELLVAITNELIRARNECRITQQELEALSGVRQPMIARIEKGKSLPTIDTLLRLLNPLGKTLAIVSINSPHNPIK